MLGLMLGQSPEHSDWREEVLLVLPQASFLMSSISLPSVLLAEERANLVQGELVL